MSSPPFAENEGAKRKLTYADGSTCFETVVETNGVDSIRVQVTEHPFPCEILYAHMSTERVDDNNCIEGGDKLDEFLRRRCYVVASAKGMQMKLSVHVSLFMESTT